MHSAGVLMERFSLNIRFEPERLKQNSKNEAFLVMELKNNDAKHAFWCESDVKVNHPLSLAHDKQLDLGRTRIGIVQPEGSIEKRVKLYTRPNNYAGSYGIDITVYAYDEEGVIAERGEQHESVECL